MVHIEAFTIAANLKDTKRRAREDIDANDSQVLIGEIWKCHHALNHSRGRPVEEGLRDVALWNAAALATADLGEAVRARLGKTEASFPPLDD